MNDRLKTIRQMLEKTPDDTFLLYGLGMELVAADNFDEAVEQFNKCIEIDTGHLAARVELGKSLRSTGKIEDARRAFAAAMELAVSQGEKHVQDFIRQQLDGLGGPGN